MEIGELKKLFDDMTIEEKAGQLFQTIVIYETMY